MNKGVIEIAHPIYREVIPRALTFDTQVTIGEKPEWYVRPDGSLEIAGELREKKPSNLRLQPACVARWARKVAHVRGRARVPVERSMPPRELLFIRLTR